MRSRYAGGKRRRSTFAGTSGSGSLARDPITGPGPPVALRPRPRDRVDLNDFWHARHLSNLPRPYTNLIREVVSQIIGTGGVLEADELKALIGMLDFGGPLDLNLRRDITAYLREFYRALNDPANAAKWVSELFPTGGPMRSLRDVEEQAPVFSRGGRS